MSNDHLYIQNWRTLRALLGYVENGSSCSVYIYQDDATRSWHVKLDKGTRRERAYFGDSLTEALREALKANPPDHEPESAT